MRSRNSVEFQEESLKKAVSKCQSVLDAALSLGLEINSLCGGKGRCGKCLIRIQGGSVSPPTDSERRLIGKRSIDGGYRLACQVFPRGSVSVSIPSSSRPQAAKILTWGLELPVRIRPRTSKLHARLTRPTLHDQASDLERVLAAARARVIDLDVLSSLPSRIREAGWNVTLTSHSGEIVDVEPGDTRNELYGLAVDLGTTTVVAYLVGMNDGHIKGVESALNGQAVHGEDVISRVGFVTAETRRLRIMQRLVVDTVNDLITKLCLRSAARAENIYEVVCAGNTIMTSLFLGLDPSSIASAPFAPPFRSEMRVKAKHLGLQINPSAYVYTVPVVSGYIGGDVVCDTLVSGAHRSSDLCLLVDVGTNGEVVVGSRGRLYSASCAAGPAFEGAEITFGMRAEKGAIERVMIDPQNYQVYYRTIGGEKARGLCGSGLVDAIAWMLLSGVIDTGGKFVRELETDRLKLASGQPSFVVCWARENSLEKDIVVTQKDVRSLQLAKAAMFAGCSILMKRRKISSSDIHRLYLAGAFGNYLDPVSASVIGLIPEVPLGRIKPIGNGSGFGARLYLLSERHRKEAAEIAVNSRHVELSAEPTFQKEFLDATYLPHRDPGLFPRAAKAIRRRSMRPTMS